VSYGTDGLLYNTSLCLLTYILKYFVFVYVYDVPFIRHSQSVTLIRVSRFAEDLTGQLIVTAGSRPSQYNLSFEDG